MDDRYFNLIPDPATVLDESGSIIGLNQAICDLTGYSRMELLSLSATDIEASATRHICRNSPADIHADTSLYEAVLVHRDGTRIPVEIHRRRTAIDGLPHTLNIYRDISGRRLLDPEIMRSEEKFSRIFHSSPDPILITELESGKLNDINFGFMHIFGYTREEAIGRTTVELGIWPSQEARNFHVSLLKKHGYIYNQELQLCTRSGKTLTMLSSSTTMTLDGTVYLIAHLRDISERKIIESALAASESRYRHFADDLPLGVVITLEGKFKYINNALINMMGYSREEFLESPFLSYIHEEDRNRVADYHKRRMQGEQVVSPYQVSLVTKHGEVRQCKIYASTLDWEGHTSGLGVIADVTENLQFEHKLQHSIQQLQEKEKAKTRFLAAASHDLRQPLHAMGLFVSALQERVRDPETRKVVQQLDASTEALRGLLNSLLDISRLDAGVVQPRTDSCFVQDVFDRLAHDFFPSATEKKISLRFTTHPYWVKCDASLLEQILRNLLSNAIRYTNHGGVLLGCRRRGNLLRFEVWDTGIGIAQSELDNIFQEFYQVGNPERDRSQGLGLGLAIAQRLANLLNLRIEVRSAPGKGSVFAFSVPVSRETPATPEIQALHTHGHFSNALILVIDDELAIREASKLMLENWGCTVLLADSVESALKSLAHSHRRPAAIIADYRLRNNRTGAEAIREIHQAYQPDIPAIIITGDTDPARLREAKESGYHLLHKPLAPAKLRTLLSHLLSG